MRFGSNQHIKGLLRHGLLSLFLVFSGLVVKAQHTYVPKGGMTDHILDRLEIKLGKLANDYFHLGSHSIRRQQVALFADSFPVTTVTLSGRDYFNLSYLINDNFEWSNNVESLSKKPVRGTFYKRKSALYSVQEKDFNLVVNPLAYFMVSTDKYNGNPTFLNNRGVEIRGNVGQKIGFYTAVSDEITNPYSWVGEYMNRDSGTLMYANFVKSYPKNFNYFLSSAYVSGSFNKYMDVQFGHFKNFIGDGQRSFIIGGIHPEYLCLRLNTRIWKMNYTNIWAELRDPAQRVYAVQRRHYMATHHLSLNLGKNFNLGMFETILFNRDSGYSNTGFDPNYLNPLIFYKSLENGLNSTDKTIIGINYKWNFKRQFSLYGQVVISEFVLKEILAANGWMHNKFSVQTGIKYLDVAGVKNLDVQAELNLARPFHYSSFNQSQSFSNFRQFMAHPLGANFYEAIGIVRYQPANRWNIVAKVIWAQYGNDTNGSNYGKDLRLSYRTTSTAPYGNFIGQGIGTNLLFYDICSTWMPKHNLFVDFVVGGRTTQSDLALFNSKTLYVSLALRLNLVPRNYDF